MLKTGCDARLLDLDGLLNMADCEKLVDPFGIGKCTGVSLQIEDASMALSWYCLGWACWSKLDTKSCSKRYSFESTLLE